MSSFFGETSHAEGLNDGRDSRRIDWRRAPKTLTTSIIDIDVSLTDIIYGRHGNGLDGPGDHRPSSVVDYTIEGVVRPSTSARGNDPAGDAPPVYVSGYEQSDRMDRGEDFDQRSVCYIATDRRSDVVRATDIFIERCIFRRLVELYASKRIDSAKISVLLNVLRDPSGAVDLPTSSHPFLRMAGDRRRQHSRAQLMSVQTSLIGATRARPAITSRSGGWGGRLARR